MLTEAQKVEMPKQFLQLYTAGKTEEALIYLRENWLIYPHLPVWAFDDEQISEVAISRHPHLSWKMSDRLQSNIRFFEKVFNQFSPYSKITLNTGRDTFFMLAYANAVEYYTKTNIQPYVSALFPSQDIEQESSAALRLAAETTNWRKWRLSDKQECSQLLSEAFPGFTSYAYEYAYYWMFRNHANDQRAQYC